MTETRSNFIRKIITVDANHILTVDLNLRANNKIETFDNTLKENLFTKVLGLGRNDKMIVVKRANKDSVTLTDIVNK